MRILKPSENIASIISMIEQANKFVVIVSPYSYLEGWDKLKNAINEAADKGVEVSYYVRQGEGLKGLEGLNVSIHEVPMLHAKMFFSERKAIIGSLHLINNQDINWAFVLNFREEYNELVKFFELYIKAAAIN